VEQAGLLGAERDDPWIWAGDWLSDRRRQVDAPAQACQLDRRPLLGGAIGDHQPVELRGDLTRVEEDRDELVAMVGDARVHRELLTERRPAVGQERRAEDQQREPCRADRPLELVGDRRPEPELLQGHGLLEGQPEGRQELSVEPPTVGLRADGEHFELGSQLAPGHLPHP
jgi:hypothetical protein